MSLIRKTASTVDQVRCWIETMPHHITDSVYDEKDTSFPPSATHIILKSYTQQLTIPTKLWRQCHVKAGGPFDSRFWRWDSAAEFKFVFDLDLNRDKAHLAILDLVNRLADPLNLPRPYQMSQTTRRISKEMDLKYLSGNTVLDIVMASPHRISAGLSNSTGYYAIAEIKVELNQANRAAQFNGAAEQQEA